MKISKGIGIDLGTTNSAVAIMDLTDSQIIMYEDKHRSTTTPSCVWYDSGKKEIVVGKLALDRRGSYPEPITSIKRKMGTSQTVRLGNKDFTPEQVSAEILKELKRQIEDKLKKLSTPEVSYIVDRAIITIPAYFKQPAIEATREAGVLAGLEVIELLHEPTAAAIHYAYTHHLTDDCTFLVFDPGGGTFDVSILRQTAGAPQVLGISGDTFLGGDDLDKRLAELIRQRLMENPESGYDLNLDIENDPEDRLRYTQLVMVAEGVKIVLTDRTSTLLRNTTSITDKNNQRVNIEMPIDREEFEDCVRDLIGKMIPKCWEALAKAHKKAGISLKDIDYILLVGGTSYVPLVQQTARENFCQMSNPPKLTSTQIDKILEQIVEEHRDTARALMERGERARCTEPTFESPDTCNARGAAIRAALSGGVIIYNDEETVRILFRGQGATAQDQATIQGRVETRHRDGSWQPLDDGRVSVGLPEAHYQEEDDLDRGGGFRFKGVPLQTGAVNQFAIRVYDASNQLLATLGKPILQDEEVRSLGKGITQTMVMPTPIRIEGKIKGRIGRKDLIPEMEPLPYEASFIFFLDENPGYIKIPLYQGSTLIKEIHVDIDPNLPPGTNIDFRITVDEKAYIVCKGKIGEHEFAVDIESPKKQPPTPAQIADKMHEFEEALTYHSRGEQATLRAEMRHHTQDYDDARQGNDEAKMIAIFEEIGQVVEKAKVPIAELEPPKAEFDELVAECLRMAQHLAQVNANIQVDEIERNIRVQQDVGNRAAQAHDQQTYGQAFGMLVQYGRGMMAEIEKLENAGRSPTRQDVDPVTRARGAVEHFRGVCAQLVPYAQSCARELEQAAIAEKSDPSRAQGLKRQSQTALELARRIGEIEYDLRRMQPQIMTDPTEVLRRCQAHSGDLEGIYNRLEGFMRATARKGPMPDVGRIRLD